MNVFIVKPPFSEPSYTTVDGGGRFIVAWRAREQAVKHLEVGLLVVEVSLEEAIAKAESYGYKGVAVSIA